MSKVSVVISIPLGGIIGDWNAKVGRNIWSNRQIWPWNAEWSRAKTNRVLPRERTGHSKHPLPTTQEKTLHMDVTRWSTQNQIDYILCSQRWRSSAQSAKTRPGADCDLDHEPIQLYDQKTQDSSLDCLFPLLLTLLALLLRCFSNLTTPHNFQHC